MFERNNMEELNSGRCHFCSYAGENEVLLIPYSESEHNKQFGCYSVVLKVMSGIKHTKAVYFRQYKE